MARLTYLDRGDLAAEHQDLLARGINLHRLLVHSPGGARAFGVLGQYIRHGSRLDPRLREMAILQVGWVARSAYEWSHHIKIGHDFGVTDADVAALIADSAGRPSGLDAATRLVLRAARETVAGPGVSADVFAGLQAHLDAECLTDLVITMAFYCAVVRLLATMQIDVEEEYMPYLEKFPLPVGDAACSEPVEIDGIAVPDEAAIMALRGQLRPYLRTTPVFSRDDIGPVAGTTLQFKFELLQASGTFKARGAFSNLLALDAAARAAGVTCVSAGNHAVAVAYAAMRLGIGAKVVMIRTANPARLALCHDYGAEVVLADDGASAFARVREIEAAEGRFFVHPFNGYCTVLGTATLGAEWAEQSGGLDAVVLPVGGGGLAAGVATAFKLKLSHIAVYGVEPEGADGMTRSFATGGPVKMGAMSSIADSLMAPHTEAYSYELCRRAIDDLVRVDDDALRAAMRVLFAELKLAVEPACAAATAAVLGPLRERLAGKRVGVLLCGSNTDFPTFARHNG